MYGKERLSLGVYVPKMVVEDEEKKKEDENEVSALDRARDAMRTQAKGRLFGRGKKA